MSIPKLISFVWIGPPMPDWAQDNIRLFRELNPDFAIQVCDERALLSFLRPVYEQIEGEHLWSRRSDVLRISVLLQFGGWYFDTDILPLRPLAEVYRDQGGFPRETYLVVGDTVALRHCFATDEDATRPWIANGIIGTTSDSAFLSSVLRSILMRNCENRRGWGDFGPAVFTEIIEHFPGIAHVGRCDDWFRLDSAADRRTAYKRIREAGYSAESIHTEFGDFLPYGFHHDMQDTLEL